MFPGLSPLYRREVIQDRHDMMTIYCTQPSCNFVPKVVPRTLAGTNYKVYYKNKHPDIPHSKEQAKAITNRKAGLQEKKPFFKSATSEQSHNERYRVLLLEFITKNNLSFALVEQLETKALFRFLSPDTKRIMGHFRCFVYFYIRSISSLFTFFYMQINRVIPGLPNNNPNMYPTHIKSPWAVPRAIGPG